jgi:hypothetical protein
VQKKADTYHGLLRHVSSQSEQDSGCVGHSKVVACPRRELERKFEIVLLAENARMELKSLANESCGADLHFPV